MSKSPAPVPAKPRIRPLSPTQFAVDYRGQQGHVHQDERSGRWYASRCVNERDLEGIYRVCWRSEEALDVLLARLDDVADCQAAAVAADQAESKGLRKRIVSLGGVLALDAYDRALLKVQRCDLSGYATVVGMLKAASQRKAPTPIEVEVADYSRKYSVRVLPGFSVQVGELTYFIGEQAEYGSYNLHYCGTITNIAKATVTVSQDDTGGSRQRRLKLVDFARRNVTDVATKHERNADTMQYI